MNGMMAGCDTTITSRLQRTRRLDAGPIDATPTWMASGLRGLARMTAEEREIAVDNLENLVYAAYGSGSTPAMRGPEARERSRDVLVRLGWAEPMLFIRCSRDEVLSQMLTAIAASGLDAG